MKSIAIGLLSLLTLAPVAYAQSTESPASTSKQSPAGTSDIARLAKEYEQARKSGDHDTQLRSLVPLVELSKNTPNGDSGNAV